jgi:hypothetical protein
MAGQVERHLFLVFVPLVPLFIPLLDDWLVRQRRPPWSRCSPGTPSGCCWRGRAGRPAGALHTLGDLTRYHGDLLAPFAPTSNQALAPGALVGTGNRLVAGRRVESGFYLGIPLVLLLCYLTFRCRRPSPRPRSPGSWRSRCRSARSSRWAAR